MLKEEKNLRVRNFIMAGKKPTEKDLQGKSFTTIFGDEYKVSDHFEPSDFILLKQGSRDSLFVRHDPLLRVAKDEDVLGILGRKVEVNQSPSRDNEWCATSTVTYKFGGKDESITWSDCADCRKGNARGGYATYSTAMSTTRASARALRFALGLEFCSAEEMGDIDDMVDESFTDPIDDAQLNVIKSKYIKQYGYTLEDIVSYILKTFERNVDVLEDIYKGEAAQLLQYLNKSKKPVDKVKKPAKETKKKVSKTKKKTSKVKKKEE